MPKPRYNQKVNLTIKTLGLHGEGIGYWHGYTLFVDNALPGEVIEGRIIQKERRFGRSSITKLVQPSTDRVEPQCPVFHQCGGCQLMHMRYESQLQFKTQRVRDAFGKYPHLKDVCIEPCIPSPNPHHYRNKIQLPVVGTSEGMKIGLYARNSHDIVDVVKCDVHCELGEKIYQEIRPLLLQSPLIPYDFKTGTGEIRFLLIKTAVNTQECLVVIVVNEIRIDILTPLADEIMRICPEVKGVILNQNTSPENTVLSDTYHCLAGELAIKERIGDLYFYVSPASFFQVNTPQAEAIYRQAVKWADLKPGDHAIDAYCGVGTLSLFVAKHAGSVEGIECVPEAIADAQKNAELNGMGNVKFVCGDAAQVLSGLDKKADVVFLNPPRKGCSPEMVAAVFQKAPRAILYISCDPSSLARDLAAFCSSGYHVESVQPYDMFPQTAHVEMLAKLVYRHK